MAGAIAIAWYERPAKPKCVAERCRISSGLVGLPPSPPPFSPGRSRNMAAIRRRDTHPERLLRSMLHRRGLRFRIDYPIRVDGSRPIRPDVVFPRARLAVFVDGCWWHGCPEHGQRASVHNSYYWRPKIAGNVARDRKHTLILESAGWRVLRFWEHTPVDQVADAVQAAVRLVAT
jgi:DNA mismatch endonuclease, patch repair protein